MGLLKYAILGATTFYGLKYVTKKRTTDGKSLIDDFKKRVPEYLDEVNNYAERIRRDYRQTNDL
ncbi:YtxH domain-containing protein [Pedobacter sp. P26]|uniref:YtxH domain-containing protein n=1 Tax=Pedobacter sp. P26 TaxID=3423956 RepID=UPI003D670AEF